MEAASGEEALALIRNSEQFDIAVLDIMLPGIDGLTVCREIRSQNNTIGIIMLTAKTQEIDKVSGLMQGADDYVAKPFSPSEQRYCDASPTVKFLKFRLFIAALLASSDTFNGVNQYTPKAKSAITNKNDVAIKALFFVITTDLSFQEIPYI